MRDQRSSAGFGELFALAWRRDRILIPATGLALVVIAVSTAKATLDLYPNDAAVTKGLADILSAPAVVALYGPVVSGSADSLAVYKSLVLGAILTSILAFVVVRRHTRTEEEAGRLELLGAGVVGRRAPLNAAAALAALAVTVPSLLTVPLLIATGLDPVGSLACAASWITAGLTMIGVTAVAAQLTTGARACGALSLGVLAVTFALRALGDTAAIESPPGGTRWLTWLSPIGWAEKVEPFGSNRFWIVLLGAACAAGGLLLAYWLLDRRDLGAGIIREREGRSEASRWLSSPEALSVRLARGSLLGWTAGFVFLGAVLGSIAGSVPQMLDRPELADLLRQIGGDRESLIDVYFAAELKMAVVLSAAAGIQTFLHARGEESTGRAELLLARPLSRGRWLGSHLLVALLTPVWLLLVVGATAGALASGAGMPSAATLAWAAVSSAPSAWLCVAAALLLFAALPARTPFVWGFFGLAFTVAEFGELIGLPRWSIAWSPLDHIQPLPGGQVDVAMLAWTCGATAVAVALGTLQFRRRDVPA